MMRILVVLEDLSDNGANRVSLDRAAHWSRSGAAVTVFVVSSAVTDQVPWSTGVVPVFGAPGALRRRHALPQAAARLVRYARRSDVVVSGTEIGFGLLLARAVTRLTDRPFAVLVQSRIDLAVDDHVPARLRRATRDALVSADLAVCVSSGLVTPTIEYGLHAERVRAVPNAVHREHLRAAARVEPVVSMTGATPTIVGVGRLTRQKGFDLLIRAHAAVIASGRTHRLLILGRGEEREALLELARKLGVQHSVELPGAVTNPAAVMARAAAFVLSSRWEGFSLSLAEALACGTPSIAFDCVAGPAEVLDRGRYGGLVAAEDVAALAAAIRDHLDDPRELSARAAGAAVADLDIFDPARAARRHYDLLHRLVTAQARTRLTRRAAS